MNEFDQIARPDKIEIVDQKQVKKFRDYLGSITLFKGQSLWELNMKTFEINVLTEFDAALALDGSVRKEYTVKEDHMYVVAKSRQQAELEFIKKARRIAKRLNSE